MAESAFQAGFTCSLIGESPFLLECFRVLQSGGGKVHAVISPNPEVRRMAESLETKAFASLDAWLQSEAETEVDFLFSIVNNEVLREKHLAPCRHFAINYHFSLLPAYAGQHATSWALLEGQQQHGVTWHIIEGLVDSGRILKQGAFPVSTEETVHSLDLKCSALALELLTELANELSDGTWKAKPQDLEQRLFRPGKRKLAWNGILNWEESGAKLSRQFRAQHYGDYPNTFSRAKLWTGKALLYPENIEPEAGEPLPPGTICETGAAGLVVACGEGKVRMQSFLDHTGNRITSEAWVSATGLNAGAVLPLISKVAPNGERTAGQPPSDQLKQEAEQVWAAERQWVRSIQECPPLKLPLRYEGWGRDPEKQPLPENGTGPETGLENISAKSTEQEAMVLYSTVEIGKTSENTSPYHQAPREPHQDLTAGLAAVIWLLTAWTRETQFSLGLESMAGHQKTASLSEAMFFRGDLFGVHGQADRSFRDLTAQLRGRLEKLQDVAFLSRDLRLRYPALRSIDLQADIVICPASAIPETHDALLLIAMDAAKGKLLCYGRQALAGSDFAGWFLNRLEERVLNILDQLRFEPDLRLGKLELRCREDVIDEGRHETSFQLPEKTEYLYKIEAYARQSPHRLALSVTGPEAGAYSYREVLERTGQITAFIQALPGFAKGSRVAVLLERGAWLMPVVWGILRAGAVYVPLSGALPFRRMYSMLADCEPILLISEIRHGLQWSELQWGLPKPVQVLCLDHAEDERALPASSLEANREMWDLVGEQATNEISGGGWKDSYTGEWLSEQVMEEFAANIRKKVIAGLPPEARILELGSASGLSLNSLAAEAGYYLATDLSPAIAARLKEKVEARGWEQVEVRCMPAHEVSELERQEFDLIILNSVVQYFPNLIYLDQVLSDCMALLAPGGQLFLGNVWDLERKAAFESSLLDFQAQGGLHTKTDRSEELFLTRAWFESWNQVHNAGTAPIFSDLDIQAGGRELADYSYDVVLRKSAEPATGKKVKMSRRIFSREALAKKVDPNENGHGVAERPEAGLSLNGNASHSESVDGPGPGDLAYIIYTSGSTGMPKGVMISHQALQNRLLWMQDTFLLGPLDRVLHKTPVTFDVSVWELIWPWMSGASAVIAAPGAEKDPEQLIRIIHSQQVSTMHFVPSMLNPFLLALEDEAALSACFSLSNVICSGEALEVAQVRRFNDLLYNTFGTQLSNLYGPTEAAIDVTSFLCSPWQDDKRDSVPLGQPVYNTGIYILDAQKRRLPRGFKGEIALSGIQLAMGYLKRPVLTAEKFPSQTRHSEERYYLTGDLGYVDAYGQLHYLGRNDNQVKIRGNRVELGAVEAVVSSWPTVRQAVAGIRTIGGNKDLLIWYTASAEIPVSDLHNHCAALLPGYAIPTFFLFMEAFPLSLSGKTDRKKLPLPGADHGLSYEGPGDQLERRIQRVWEEELGLSPLSVTTQLMAAGGHSLKAVRIVNRLNQLPGISLRLAQMPGSISIRELAASIRSGPQWRQIEFLRHAPRERYPLSNAQERLLRISRDPEQSAAYNMLFAWELNPAPDSEALKQALISLTGTEETFRAYFPEGADSQTMNIAGAVKLPLRILDWQSETLSAGEQEAHPAPGTTPADSPASGTTPADSPAPGTTPADSPAPGATQENISSRLKTFCQELRDEPFELDRPPLWRGALIQLEANRSVLVLVFQHLIFDGSSGLILRNRLQALLAQGLDSQIPGPLDKGAREPEQYPYGAYNLSLASIRPSWLDQAKAYWKTQLEEVDFRVEFPKTGQDEPEAGTLSGNSLRYSFSAELAAQLTARAEDMGHSPFSLLLTAASLCIRLYSGRQDFVLAVPVDGRDRLHFGRTPGFFVNTLGIRCRPENGRSIRELAAEIQQALREGFDFQYLDLETMLGLEQEASQPLNLAVTHQHEDRASDPGWHSLFLPVRRVKFDLAFDFYTGPGALELELSWRSSLFSREIIADWLEQLDFILERVLADPDAHCRPDSLLSPTAQQKLAQFERGPVLEVPDASILEPIRRQVRAIPEQIAVSCYGERLSYQNLWKYSDRVAAGLLATASEIKGLGEADTDLVVGVMVERNLQLPAALLGVLKAGMVFLPLQEAYPAGRLETVLEDAGCQLLLVSRKHQERLKSQFPAISLVEMETLPDATPRPLPMPEAEQGAYLIYTSGSTGLPKGVRIQHAALVNLAKALEQGLYQHQERAWKEAYVTPVIFDVSIQNLLCPLVQGNTICMVSETDRRDPGALLRFIRAEAIDQINITPTLLTALLSHPEKQALSGLKQLLVGAEALKTELVRRVFELPGSAALKIINIYGPTENCIDTTLQFFGQDQLPQGQIASIGRPLGNVNVQLRDSEGFRVPVGAAGELLIGGANLFAGYTRAELESEVWSELPAGRFYKSGDQCVWLPDGNLSFLGRKDKQLKIRGYRVEPGEVENQLLRIPEIKDTVVLPVLEEERHRLHAWLVFNTPLEKDALLARLREKLPEYMVPSRFFRLDKMPQGDTGKVDRKSLPGLMAEELLRKVSQANPETEQEALLLMLWQEYLGTLEIGLDDGFFALGGDSIQAIQVQAALRRSGWILSMQDLYRYRTIRESARFLKPVNQSEPQSEDRLAKAEPETLPLLPIQHLFFDWFGPQQPHFRHYNLAFGLEAEGELEPDQLEAALRSLIGHHLALRLRFRRGAQGWEQYVNPTGDEPLVEVRTETDEEAEVLAEAHRSLDPERGPLWKAILLRRPEGDRFLWICHHLMFDFVSWRSMARELEERYYDPEGNHPLDGLYHWSERLQERKQSQHVERAFRGFPEWNPENAKYHRLKFGDGQNLVREAVRNSVQIPIDFTEALQRIIGDRGGLGLQAALLVALCISLDDRFGTNRPMIWLEKHGREALDEGSQPAAMIGWFTSLFPFLLDIPAREQPAPAWRTLYNKLQLVPAEGLDFGLKSFNSNTEDKSFQPPFQIAFNYLGKPGQQGAGQRWKPLDFNRDDLHAPDLKRLFQVEIIAKLNDSGLELDFVYNPEVVGQRKMWEWMQAWPEALTRVKTALEEPQADRPVPADFSLCRLAVPEFDTWISESGLSPERIEDIYPLTSTQEGMLYHWLTAQAEPGFREGLPAYTAQIGFSISGSFGEKELRAAIHQLQERHAGLRTLYFHDAPHRPLQLVYQDAGLEVSDHDWSDLDALAFEERLETWKIADRKAGFELSNAVPLRIAVFRKSNVDASAVLSSHHIALDGWSLMILLQELASCLGGKIPESRPLPFASYLTWLDTQHQQAGREFWRDYLSGLETPTPIPTWYIPDPEAGPDYQSRETDLSTEHSHALRRLAREAGVTLNQVFLAAWGLMLSWLHDSNDVLFGTVLAGRPEALEGSDEAVGLFMRTLPVRLKPDPGLTLREWLLKVQETWMALLPHQYLALNQIEAASGNTGNLINHMLVFENYPVEQAEGSAAQITDVKGEEHNHYAFTLLVKPAAPIGLEFSFNAAVYPTAQIQYLEESFLALLRAMVDQPDKACKALDFHSPSSQARIKNVFNATTTEVDEEGTIVSVFREQARRVPDQLAVRFRDQELSYAELDHQSDQVARLLLAGGRKIAGERVGIYMERSEKVVTAMLGIMKAGGTYVPLDLNAPEKRIEYIIQDSSFPCVLFEGARPETATKSETDWLDFMEAMRMEKTPLPAGPSSRDLCYVVYTSGSTGWPKGVQIHHRAILNLVRSHVEKVCSRFDHVPSVGAVASYAFDPSVRQMYIALLSGWPLYVVEDEVKFDGPRFAEWLEKEKVEVADGTPGLFQLLVEAWENSGRKPVTHFILGGEALPKELVARYFRLPGAIETGLTNAYGPTESGVDTSIYLVDPDEVARCTYVPIGEPLQNTAVMVARDLEPVDIGMLGELCVEGVGVSPGYLNKAELNQEKFLTGPSGEMLYRSGDLVRWLPDGKIEYHGRIDSQVKVRGYRIELQGIEEQLNRHPDILRAVVMTWNNAAGEKELAAWFTSSVDVDSQVLYQYLATYLPIYMIPSRFIQIPAFPLTVNGKVNRRALPEPGERLVSGNGTEGGSVRTAAELRLALIWEQVLSRKGIGIHDDFYSLGGHSLAAVRLAGHIEQAFGKQISPSVLLRHRTVAGLSAYLELDELTYPNLVLLQDAGGPPAKQMFLVHPAGGTCFCYRELVSQLPGDWTTWGFERSDPEKEPFSNTVEALAAHYLGLLLEQQPEGPYLLGGWSFGALVSYEMARQLSQAQQEVELLFLIDGYFPALTHDEAPAFSEALMFAEFFEGQLQLEPEEFEGMDFESRLDHLLEIASGRELLPAGYGRGEVERLLRIRKANAEAAANYGMPPWPGPILNVMATDRGEAQIERIIHGLHDVCGCQGSSESVSGDHYTVLNEPDTAMLLPKTLREIRSTEVMPNAGNPAELSAT